MATYTSKYKGKEIDDLLRRSDEAPMILYYDQAAALYRAFTTEAKRDAWLSDSEMYASYELFNFVAPAPYAITLSGLNPANYYIEGTESILMQYSMVTADGNGGVVSEGAKVTYKVENEGSSETWVSYLSAAETASVISVELADHLHAGYNALTITIVGNETGATKSTTISYTIVTLSLDVAFNINKVWDNQNKMNLSYLALGSSDKQTNFVIDGTETTQSTTVGTNTSRTNVSLDISSLTPGRHTLQAYTVMDVNGITYQTPTYFYEFIVTGDASSEYTTISYQYAKGTILAKSDRPTIQWEAYTTCTLHWGFYTPSMTKAHTTVEWYAIKDDSKKLIKSAYVENQNDEELADLKFVPSESGTYTLQAEVEGTIVGQYTAVISVNNDGISETTDYLGLKLSALNKSNNDNDEQKNNWSYGAYSTTFNNVPFNDTCGWINDALWLTNGATASINYAPFAFHPTTQGCTFEIEFETYGVLDETANVVTVDTGDGVSGKLEISATKATLTSALGTKSSIVTTRYKDGERIKLAFVINPVDSSISNDNNTVMIINNGVIERCAAYDSSDNYNSAATITLGNADALAGVKIYNIRCYQMALTENQEFNHYVIDSEDSVGIVDNNDIYVPGSNVVSVSKLQSKIDTILIDGAVNTLGANKNKTTIIGTVQRICPYDSSKNFTIENCTLRTHGQSTLGTPVPSIKFWSKKGDAVMTEGLISQSNRPVIPKGRYQFKEKSAPANKWVLQANYQDSSGVHNGGIERLLNDTWYDAKVGDNYVLRTPPQAIAADWANQQGPDGAKFNSEFPYNVRTGADSLPCVVCWRPTGSTDPYQFLGNYVLMDDKKSDYNFGERSLYNCKKDPYKFLESDSNKAEYDEYTRIWDNKNTLQIEVLRNTNELSMYESADTYFDTNDDGVRWQQAFEFIYPDQDDLEADGKLEQYATLFHDNYVKPLCDTYQNHEAFRAWASEHLDLYKMAAYYIFLMRFGLVDNIVRNAQIKTYDGVKWWFEPWDMDIACGLRNDGKLMFDPPITRDTKDPDNPEKGWAFGGRSRNMNEDEDTDVESEDTSLHSCWLWDALEQWDYFSSVIVPSVAESLYKAGLQYTAVNKMFDENYSNYWCEKLYNSNGRTKYIDQFKQYNNAGYLSNLQGKRETHRHWWLKSSFDYWDSKWVVGDYTQRQLYIRSNGAPANSDMTVTAARTMYYGWGKGGAGGPVQTGVLINKGETYSFKTDSLSQTADPYVLYQPFYYSKIDLSSLAPYFNMIQFDGCTDEVIGSFIKELNIGISTTDLGNGVINAGNVTFSDMANITSTDGTAVPNLTKVEKFNIQGLAKGASMEGFNMVNMTGLKEFYAGCSGLNSISAETFPSGITLDKLYLNDTIKSIQMNGVDWKDIKFMDSHSYSYESTIPSSITNLYFTNMGSSLNVKSFVLNWLNGKTDAELANCTCILKDLKWEGVSIDDVFKLGKLPETSKSNFTGYIIVDAATLETGEFTSQQAKQLTDMFGDTIFTYGAKFVISTTRGFTISVTGDTEINERGEMCIVEGSEVKFDAILFPVEKRDLDLTWNISQAQVSVGKDVQNIVSYQSLTLNRTTGVMTSEESSYEYENAGRDATITVQDASDTTIRGNLSFNVIKKSYPKSVELKTVGYMQSIDNDELFVTNSDNVKIAIDPKDANGNDLDFTGTIESATWSLDCEDDICAIVERDVNLRYCKIQGKTFGDKTPINCTLKLVIRFANKSVFTKTITLHLIAEYGVLYNSSQTGNPYLYNVFENLLGKKEGNAAFTNVDLSKYSGNLILGRTYADGKATTNTDTSFTSFIGDANVAGSNVLNYLTNVDYLYCEFTSSFNGAIDTTGMTSLTGVTLSSNNGTLPTFTELKINAENLKQWIYATAETINNVDITNLNLNCAFKPTATTFTGYFKVQGSGCKSLWSAIMSDIKPFVGITDEISINSDADETITEYSTVPNIGRLLIYKDAKFDKFGNDEYCNTPEFDGIETFNPIADDKISFSGNLIVDVSTRQGYVDYINNNTNVTVTCNKEAFMDFKDRNAEKLVLEYVNGKTYKEKVGTTYVTKTIDSTYGVLGSWLSSLKFETSIPSNVKHFPELGYFGGMSFRQAFWGCALTSVIVPRTSWNLSQGYITQMPSSFEYFDFGLQTTIFKYNGTHKCRYLILHGDTKFYVEQQGGAQDAASWLYSKSDSTPSYLFVKDSLADTYAQDEYFQNYYLVRLTQAYDNDPHALYELYYDEKVLHKDTGFTDYINANLITSVSNS